MTRLTDEEVKQELVCLLKDLIAILDENNFRYSIWAGTLLGAVRHKGFIPWDDDIDLAMTREEYDRFLMFIKDNPEINQRFIGFELGKTDFPFLKFVNPDIQVKTDKVLDKILWIDIFPIDYVPKEYGQFFSKQRKLNKLYWMNRKANNPDLPRPVKKGMLKKLYNNMYITIAGMLPSSYCVSRLIEHAKSCPKDKAYMRSCVINGVFEREMFPVEYMDTYEDILFEGISVKAIKKHREWLEIRYGDYMTLPPENQRVAHALNVYKK